ncbi:hypothetical protein C8R46DRAFT_1223830 [Mycena filopes]|nr:hypothetical protein C8R46DRAFT_1223830 [Mycena filopes]
MSLKRKSRGDDDYAPRELRAPSTQEKAVRAERNRIASASYYARAAIKAKRRRTDPPKNSANVVLPAPTPSPPTPPPPMTPPPMTPPPMTPPLGPLAPRFQFRRANECWESTTDSSDDSSLPTFRLSPDPCWMEKPTDDTPPVMNDGSSGLSVGIGSVASFTSAERVTGPGLLDLAETQAAETSADEEPAGTRACPVINTPWVHSSPAKPRPEPPAMNHGNNDPLTRVERMQARVANLNSGALSWPTPAEVAAWERCRRRYEPPELETLTPERWKHILTWTRKVWIATGRGRHLSPVHGNLWDEAAQEEFKAAAEDLSIPMLRMTDSVGTAQLFITTRVGRTT